MADATFEGKYGLITGAASGIGRGASMHLAGRGAGLVLVDMDDKGLKGTAETIEKNGGPAPLTIRCDVSDPKQVEEMVSAALAKFGAVDFSVHAAGIAKRTAFIEIPIDEWDLMMKVNLTGVFLCCQAVAKPMVERGKGSIINVASVAGRTCSILGGSHYTAAKHAVVGLSRHSAMELGPKGVRVNAFCPGLTITPMVDNIASEDELKATAARFPLRRWSTPEEQAKVIAFLAGDDSGFMTGACLDSNGGAIML